MSSFVISLIAAVLYGVAGGLLAVRLAREAYRGVGVRRVVLAAGALAVVLHALALHQAIFVAAGLNLSFFNVLSLVSWLVALLLLLAALSRPVENLGVAVFPFAALAVLLKLGFPAQQIALEDAPFGLNLHVLLSILAYSLLTIAALQAALLHVQDTHLHNRHPGGFIRALPPLQTMESMLFQMIGLGFVLLSLSLFSGALFLEDIFAQHLVHKTVLSIIGWVVFAVLLWGRWRFGWRGRTAIRWAIGGFVVLMLAYFGSKLVLELILNR